MSVRDGDDPRADGRIYHQYRDKFSIATAMASYPSPEFTRRHMIRIGGARERMVDLLRDVVTGVLAPVRMRTGVYSGG